MAGGRRRAGRRRQERRAGRRREEGQGRGGRSEGEGRQAGRRKREGGRKEKWKIIMRKNIINSLAGGRRRAGSRRQERRCTHGHREGVFGRSQGSVVRGAARSS